MTIAVCVGTNRPDRYRRLREAWADQDIAAEWYVAWDLDHLPGDVGMSEYEGDDTHDTHASIAAEFGDRAWIIPQRTGAIRSWALFRAWQAGHEVLVMLDDDVLPSGPGHLRDLATIIGAEIQNEWIGGGPQKQRGIPFLIGKRPVKLHEGLWWNVPDIDAPTRLVEGVRRLYERPYATGINLVPPGTWLAFSAMHVVVHRDLIPAMYQLLMGPAWRFHRFDDIWSGMFAKKICDHLGWAVTMGGPLVEHEQASDPLNNLVAEAPGIAEHERRWRDIAAIPVAGDCATCAYRSIAAGVARLEGAYPWAKLAEAMSLWADLFGCQAERPVQPSPAASAWQRVEAFRESVAARNGDYFAGITQGASY